MLISTQQMIRTHSLDSMDLELAISDKSLERVKVSKLLGVHLSNDLKVAPDSFSAREEWELNWHKRAREERDSPSQMTCANQPPRRTFPKSD